MTLRVALLALLVVPAATAASDLPSEKTKAVLQRFERLYHSTATLRASFLERYIENGKEARSEAGIAYFGKPGKMRWEYLSPEKNLFVIDGKWSWFYVPSDRTVTRIRARESSDWRTPLSLLAGEMKVSTVCRRVSLDASVPAVDPHGIVLTCLLHGASESPSHDGAATAMQENYAEKVVFELNVETGELLRVLIFDPGGVQIEFRFSEWRFNPPVDSQIFRFDPPPGVTIVNGQLPFPEGSRPGLNVLR